MSFYTRLYGLCAALILFTLAPAGCGDEPLFDELATSRLKVVIKGTYESNDPRDWDPGPITQDDSVDNKTFTEPDPDKFMLDIAELQMGGKKFALYRETYTFDVNDTDPFFNGTGVIYENDDPPERTYSHVNVYLRKMIFNNARKYYLEYDAGNPGEGKWTNAGAAETIFKESAVEGFDFNQLQVNSYYDSLRQESADINRIFPIAVPIDGNLTYLRDNPETVLEIRLVIKNFIKKYEYDYSSDYRYVYHFFGLSDWLRDVKAGDTYMGGNLHAVARTYVPGKTAIISGFDVAAAAGCYVVAIRNDDDIANYRRLSTQRDRSITVDQPKAPDFVVPNDVESYLDFYLKYEKFKVDYNSFKDDVDDGTYATGWDTYESNVLNYKIPPIVTWSSDGNYSFTNVPVGYTYKIYYSSADDNTIAAGDPNNPNKGNLPSNFNDPAKTVTLLESDAGTVVPVP